MIALRRSDSLAGLCYMFANTENPVWTSARRSDMIVPAKGGGADMRTTIEELYYGNIMPYNRSVRAGSEYANLIGLLARNEAELLGTLTEAQKETFEKIKDCWMEMNSINEVTIFTHGFKLGLRLTAESLISSKAEQEPIIE